MPHVIDFTTAGTVQSMHTDKFDLGFLGERKVTRASDIIFDTHSQRWGIALAVGGGIYMTPTGPWVGFDSYEEARDFEVRALNRCRSNQVDPTSPEGTKLANLTPR